MTFDLPPQSCFDQNMEFSEIRVGSLVGRGGYKPGKGLQIIAGLNFLGLLLSGDSGRLIISN